MSDIALLFARDPFEHTDQDIDAIIERMREARNSFNTRAPGVATPKLTAKEQEAKNSGIKLSVNLALGKK